MLTSFAVLLLPAQQLLRPAPDARRGRRGVGRDQAAVAVRRRRSTVTLILNPMFSALVVRFPVRRFIPISYQFFVANMLVFYVVLRFLSATEGSTVDVWTARALLRLDDGVRAVQHVDLLVFDGRHVQQRAGEADVRLHRRGRHARLDRRVGGTAALATRIGAINLLLVSAALLELAVFTVMRFPMRDGGATPMSGGSVPTAATGARRDRRQRVGGFHARRAIAVSARDRAASCCCSRSARPSCISRRAISSGRAYADRATRTAVLAQLELAVQTLTVLTQIFLTGRIIRWLGLAAALAVLPVLSIVGFGALGAFPVFAMVAVFTVLRRGGNFAVTNPAMEVLFTVVKREDKYKAKNVIETFVYRGGDQIGGWAYRGLAALGLTLVGISYVAIPLSVVFLGLGLWLGWRQAELAQGATPADSPPVAVPATT